MFSCFSNPPCYISSDDDVFVKVDKKRKIKSYSVPKKEYDSDSDSDVESPEYAERRKVMAKNGRYDPLYLASGNYGEYLKRLNKHKQNEELLKHRQSKRWNKKKIKDIDCYAIMNNRASEEDKRIEFKN